MMKLKMPDMFRPAATLMRRMDYGKKFSILAALTLYSALILALPFISEINRHTDDLKGEAIGVAPIETALKATRLIQLSRFLSVSSEDEQARHSTSDQVLPHLNELYQLVSQDNENGKTEKNLTGEMLILKKQWSDIRTKSDSPEYRKSIQCIDDHSMAISMLKHIVDEIGDKYKLHSDSDSIAHYLSIAATEKIPDVIEYNEQMRTFEMYLARKGTPSGEDRMKLFGLSAKMSDAMRSAEYALNQAGIGESIPAGISKELSSLAQVAAHDAREITSNKINGSPESLNGTLLLLTDRAYSSIFDALLPEIRRLINARGAHYESFRARVLLLSAAILLLNFYLSFGVFQATTNGIKSLITTMKRYTGGDYNERASLPSNDELKIIGDSFNKMADGISAMMISIHDEERRFKDLVNAAPFGIHELDLEGFVLSSNKAANELFESNKVHSSGQAFKALASENESRRVGFCFENAAFGEISVCEYSAAHDAASIFKTRFIPIRDDDGRVTKVMALTEDISHTKHAEYREKLIKSVFSHTREGIIISDVAGNIVDINEAFTSITGYQREDVIGKSASIIRREGADHNQASEMWKSLAEIGYWRGEGIAKRKDGTTLAEMSSVSVVHDQHGNIQNYVTLLTDITEMKEHHNELHRVAHHDALTNLPNRVLLADRLQQAMSNATRHNNSVAVAYLDLDGFKAVNDTHGHNNGDELLKEISKRMKESLRDGDTLARIGGDEFIIVLVDIEGKEGCVLALDRLLEAASTPVTVNGLSLRVSASIGVTIYPDDDGDADMLLRHADQAMYIAKQAGKNQHHFFDVDHDATSKTRRETIEHITKAIRNDEMMLFYQPKVNMKTGEVIGAEALIRWNHPERGILSPSEFLPVVEGHEISIELGEWVIDNAMYQISIWQSKGLHITVSVNICALQLQQENFVGRLQTLLARYPGVDSSMLQIEVLETSALEDVIKVSEVMHQCKNLGVSFALDDFGTGYSSLTYLKRLPANVLKIDQSFVRDMIDDQGDLAIVKGVMGLASAFQREIIAEGVESIAHGELLISLGCIIGQGYGISKPIPAKDFIEWASTWEPDSAWTQPDLLFWQTGGAKHANQVD